MLAKPPAESPAALPAAEAVSAAAAYHAALRDGLLLLGAEGFYEGIFESIGVPYTAVQWRTDVNPVDREEAMIGKQMQVANLINMYRVRGHLIADLDPLAASPPKMHPELDPAFYGLTIWDNDREFLTGFEAGVYAPVGGKERMKLGDILGVLRDAYCRTSGIEYTHISSIEEKRWIQEQVEGASTKLDPTEQRHILDRMNAAEAIEKFLATKWMGQKRFGLEGAESTIAILDAILDRSADQQMAGAVLGMAHRGRLNVLVNIVGKSYGQLFKEFEGHVDPDSIQGSGDVKYHLGALGKYESPSGADIKIELAANPSHLETVDPIVMGQRAKNIEDGDNVSDHALGALAREYHLAVGAFLRETLARRLEGSSSSELDAAVSVFMGENRPHEWPISSEQVSGLGIAVSLTEPRWAPIVDEVRRRWW